MTDTANSKPRALMPEETQVEEAQSVEESTGRVIGITLSIDKDSRNLCGFKVYGVEKFPCSYTELIGWMEVAKSQLMLRSINEE